MITAKHLSQINTKNQSYFILSEIAAFGRKDY